MEYLYVEADEDHIHKQEKNGTEKKGSMIGKLLYLYEGQEQKDRRKELKNVFYLGDLFSGGEANRHMFERMQGIHRHELREPVSECGVYQWRWRSMDQSRGGIY